MMWLETRTPDAIIKQRFTRRFLFGVNMIFSTLLAALLLLLGLAHQNNWVLLKGEMVFAGFFNPYLLIGSAALLAVVEIHALWLLWREQRLRSRRFAFAVHGVLSIFSGMLLLFLTTSSWMVEGLKQGYGYGVMPQLPPPPSPVIWIFPLAVILVFLPQGLWWLYQELLERALNRAAAEYERPKRHLAEPADYNSDDFLYAEDLTDGLKAQRN